jgi:uncharacterized membrane protein
VSPISIKALLISNAVQVAMFLAICIVAALGTLAVAWGLAGFPADIKPLTGELKGWSVFMRLLGAVSVMPSSVAAGYVAGRLARRRPALHGALSSCAWFVLLILVVLAGPPSHEPPHTGPGGGSPMPAVVGMMVYFFGPPLLGALGGLFARQADLRRREQPQPTGLAGVRNDEGQQPVRHRTWAGRRIPRIPIGAVHSSRKPMDAKGPQ